MDTFRKEYRKLEPREVALVQEVKERADAMLMTLEAIGSGRDQALAKTKLEESVMWAVKAITG